MSQLSICQRNFLSTMLLEEKANPSPSKLLVMHRKPGDMHGSRLYNTEVINCTKYHCRQVFIWTNVKQRHSMRRGGSHPEHLPPSPPCGAGRKKIYILRESAQIPSVSLWRSGWSLQKINPTNLFLPRKRLELHAIVPDITGHLLHYWGCPFSLQPQLYLKSWRRITYRILLVSSNRRWRQAAREVNTKTWK